MSQKPNRLNGIEQLQSRELMAGDTFGAISSSPMDSGKLEVQITGTDQVDRVIVQELDHGTNDKSDDTLQVRQTSNGNTVVRGYPLYNNAGGKLIGKISFEGRDGNDTFRNYTSIPSEANGGDGNDVLVGGSENDTLDGGRGADWVFGKGGDDQIDGGWGEDFLSGGDGEDRIDGGWHNDRIYGGDEDDRVKGGGGDDTIKGGDGDDYINGQWGHDTIDGGDGYDELKGGDGRDNIQGGAKSDTIKGGRGDDVLRGGAGNDGIRGEEGNDVLFGGTGNDVLRGGDDNDTVIGEEGTDFLFGDAGYDLLDGGADNDWLYGGLHDDLLFGGDGVDHLFGEDGNDRLSGGQLKNLDPFASDYGGHDVQINDVSDGDADYLTGGSGRDRFVIGDDYWYTWGHKDEVLDEEGNEEVVNTEPSLLDIWFGSFSQGGIPLMSTFGNQADRDAP